MNLFLLFSNHGSLASYFPSASQGTMDLTAMLAPATSRVVRASASHWPRAASSSKGMPCMSTAWSSGAMLPRKSLYLGDSLPDCHLEGMWFVDMDKELHVCDWTLASAVTMTMDRVEKEKGARVCTSQLPAASYWLHTLSNRLENGYNLTKCYINRLRLCYWVSSNVWDYHYVIKFWSYWLIMNIKLIAVCGCCKSKCDYGFDWWSNTLNQGKWKLCLILQ